MCCNERKVGSAAFGRTIDGAEIAGNVVIVTEVQNGGFDMPGMFNVKPGDRNERDAGTADAVGTIAGCGIRMVFLGFLATADAGLFAPLKPEGQSRSQDEGKDQEQGSNTFCREKHAIS